MEQLKPESEKFYSLNPLDLEKSLKECLEIEEADMVTLISEILNITREEAVSALKTSGDEKAV